MTIRLQEVVRSEVEGGLSGPANPIPSQSIDCGCRQLPCPKLARFATRRMFVGLICWVGLLQAASSAYFYVTGPTIGRRFQLDPYLIDWILVVSELTPFVLGLIVAYWGDKIHRASWLGALVLLQCVAYVTLIIPHLTHRVRVIEETLNVTHMSLYADDSPDLCSASTSRIIGNEDDTCYFTLVMLIFVQIVMGMANIAYYALSISYLDDNTKKQHVAGFIGVIVAVKVIGVLLGYILAWGCLRIDAEDLKLVESYQEQIGAWWLGFPILALALVIPGLFLSWFPRRLPSEVVEQAAESILDRAGTMNRRRLRSTEGKAGSPDFFPTLGRLISNKLLICNIFATAFCASAILNFMTQENIILESRYQIPRPTGMLLGFNDPLPSRLIASILKPVLIGLIIIIVGLVLSKAKPRATFIAGYNFIMIVLATLIIVALIFAICDTPPIIGLNKGSITLLKDCNRDCRCSKDADFRPVCDIRGMFTFYSPCHAGCTSVEYVDTMKMKIYGGCSCVEDATADINSVAKEGPCGASNCQVGWLVFEFGTLLAYALIASTFIGDLLINLRSVYKQDKASSIGFWMMWIAIFVNVPGKILYQSIADMTCVHWGIKKSVCHLHDSKKFGNYMLYLTTLLLAISVLFRILVWIFCRNLQIYSSVVNENEEDTGNAQELMPINSDVERNESEAKPDNNGVLTSPEETPKMSEAEPQQATPKPKTKEESNEDKQDEESNKPLKYGPLGPGDRRQTIDNEPLQRSRPKRQGIRTLDSDDELGSSSDESKKDSSPKVAYIPLDLDSDVESDLGSTAPRSRKRVVSKDYDEYTERSSSSLSAKRREFPNPDDYGDPRSIRNAPSKNRRAEDGSSKTSSFEYSKMEGPKQGDFNEVGIPIVEYHPKNLNDHPGPNSPFLKDVKSLINRYEKNTSQETLEDDRASVRSAGKTGIPLVAMAQPRLSSGQASSGFSSLRESSSDARGTPSPKNSSIKGSKGALCTDL